ncbi:MAG: sodium:solute symporter family protein [Solobacterium sp.]|jgi:SSS family solute:Na+ symporter|nr:sodium:solute symporter family protein [Solobacterium sp.]
MSQGVISVLIIVVYLIAMLTISVIHGKKAKANKNAVSFFLANRGVSSVLLPLTMIAAMQSTFAFLGAPGMYYTHGVSYIVIVLSQVWVALMVIYFGNKVRKLAVERGYMSIGDYFQDRYKSKYIKIVASIVSVVMTMVFLAMQYVGNARAISVVSNGVISYNVAIIINVLFSLAYVLIGGAGGVVMLDAIQAVILIVGIVVAAIVALVPTGGIVNLFTQIKDIDPTLLSRPGAKGMYTGSYWFMQFIVLPFGIWLCPHVWMKSLMAKDEKALAKSAISIPVSQLLIFGFSTLFIGLAGHILVNAGDLSAADNVLPVLMLQNFNWVGAALIMAAAIAAGMSTINSMLLAVSQIMSQDLILINKKGKISDSQNMKLSRTVVLIVAIICALIALDPPETLVQIVQDVAYTGLAQLAPPFVLGLYWKDNSRLGAALGLTVGELILFATRIIGVSPLGIPGFMWGFVINILLNVIVSLIVKNKNSRQTASLEEA